MVLLASDYDQTRFLKATDLPTPRKFRIKCVTEEPMDQDKTKKLVVWFTNDEHGLVLNKTNNRILRGAFGDPVDHWKGQIIVIFSEMKNNGKLGLSVRIPPAKQATAAPAAPQPPAPQPSSGNGATAVAKPEAATPPVRAVRVSDPELEAVPLDEEMGDDIPF